MSKAERPSSESAWLGMLDVLLAAIASALIWLAHRYLGGSWGSVVTMAIVMYVLHLGKRFERGDSKLPPSSPHSP